MIEERSASPPHGGSVAVAAAPAGDAGAKPAAEAYKVVMKSAGRRRSRSSRRSGDHGPRTQEAKELADKIPRVIKENVSPTSDEHQGEAGGAGPRIECSRPGRRNVGS